LYCAQYFSKRILIYSREQGQFPKTLTLHTEAAEVFISENNLAYQGLIGWGTLTFRNVKLHTIG